MNNSEVDKIMKNKLISIILVYTLSFVLIGCGNDLVHKSIENAKVYMENKEYDKFNEAEEIINKLDYSLFTGLPIEEAKIQEFNVEQQIVVEKKKYICFICKQEDYISNLQELHGFGVVHNYCYESAPVCYICNQTKLIGNEDLNENGICDYKCDKLCTNCWTQPKNSEVSGLCNECEWNKYYSNKATCGGYRKYSRWKSSRKYM